MTQANHQMQDAGAGLDVRILAEAIARLDQEASDAYYRADLISWDKAAADELLQQSEDSCEKRDQSCEILERTVATEIEGVMLKLRIAVDLEGWEEERRLDIASLGERLILSALNDLRALVGSKPQGA